MMRRMISLLLALLLALGMIPALAAGADAAKPPEVGDVVYGFEALEIRDYDALGARMTWFEHQKTGAKLLYIANNDINRAFQLAFRTRAEDDTGLPHVFEHATLYGNEKYPSKSLFFNLYFQTYNTFMNALTGYLQTVYPMASLSEAQLLSLADYYTEACLHPLIMTDESIFESQAWHYEMADMDSPLTYNGVVYSEMLGGMTLWETSKGNAYRTTFPGASCGWHCFGDPDHIPELTWERVKAYHDRYYHPSNCTAFLYGDFEDYTAFLKLLDEAFNPFERVEFSYEENGYAPITEPMIESVSYPVPAGTDTAGQSVIYYSILCSGMRDDVAQERLADHAIKLLESQSSPMMQTLKHAMPGGAFSVERSKRAPEDAVVFIARNVELEDAGLFRDTVDAALAQIAAQGFDETLADAVSTGLRLDARLALDNGDVLAYEEGKEGCLIRLDMEYSCTGDPFRYVEDQEALDDIVDENARGLLAGAVEEWLLAPELYTLVTTYPDAGGREAHDAALADKLAGIKAGMCEEELQAIVDATHAEPEAEDNSAMVAALKPITVADLPEEYRQYEISDETDADGVRHIDVLADVDGVGTAYVLLDARALGQEDLHWLMLFARLVGELPTNAHTREEVLKRVDRYLRGSKYSFVTFENVTPGDFDMTLAVKWRALDEDLAEGYALIGELLLDTRFDDVPTLKRIVSTHKSDGRNRINQNGVVLLMTRQAAIDDPLMCLSEYIGDLDYYAFLEQVEAQLEEDPQPVIDHLTALQAFLANRSGAVSGFAGNEASIALNRPLADAFFAKLPCVARDYPEYDLPVPAAREAVILDSNVQHNGVLACFAALGIEDDRWLDVCSRLVQDRLMLPVLREQMGAYAAYCQYDPNGGIILLSYCDPNVAETFDYFGTLPGQIAGLEIAQDELDGYIMRAYAELARPEGELTGAVSEIERVLIHKSADEKLVAMRQLKAVTPERVKDFAGVIEALVNLDRRCTVGSAAAINANAGLYDVILNPFGEQGD